jgi:hypothetical protein
VERNVGLYCNNETRLIPRKARRRKMEFDELSIRVIGLAIEVHRELGPGLLESSYKQCLAYELSKAKLQFVTEYELPIIYKGIKIDCGYRIDLLIEDTMISFVLFVVYEIFVVVLR